MEDCEVRLGLVSVVVREQREAQGKLEKTKIELEVRRSALERMKAEISLRSRRMERAKVFLEGLKAGSILSCVVSAGDETMSLVKEELQRQEGLEARRLALETEKMERLSAEISSHEDEVTSARPSLHKSSPFQVVQLEKEVEYIKVEMLRQYFLLLTFVKVSCFKESNLAQLKREQMLLRRSTMQRRVIQRWLEAVQRRRREKEEEMVRFVICRSVWVGDILSWYVIGQGKEKATATKG